jgi:triphosphoribosyl-dephospho-CoA synthase
LSEILVTESRTLGDRVRRAIQLESSAIKLGNVHPNASFHDLNYGHFERASAAIGQAIDEMDSASVGLLVLEATRKMMQVVETNTSLGTILLIAPLVVAWREASGSPGLQGNVEARSVAIQASLPGVLSRLDASDSEQIYQAIRTSQAGGLGARDTMDVNGQAPMRIQDAMQLASAWDDIALQYSTNFDLVFRMAQRLWHEKRASVSWQDAVRQIQLELLSERVDSLIARKRGIEYACEIQSRAKSVLHSGEYGSPGFESAWLELDHEMRDGNHRGNPGTIADLIAAALFLVD